MTNFEWTPSAIEHLRSLWTEGLTGSQIGLRLGISRAAVLGKANRLGLSARVFKHGGLQTERRVRRQPTVQVSKPPKPTVQVLEAPDPILVSFEDLQPGQCKWPIGDAKLFCGREALSGKYCPFHTQVATKEIRHASLSQ